MDLLTVAHAKARELAQIFYEAGTARDLRLKRYGGNAELALRDIRARNDELEVLAEEIERTPDAKSLGALFGSGDGQREVLGDYHRLPVAPVRLAPLGGGL